jgi:hypothetical protein
LLLFLSTASISKSSASHTFAVSGVSVILKWSTPAASATYGEMIAKAQTLNKKYFIIFIV